MHFPNISYFLVFTKLSNHKIYEDYAQNLIPINQVSDIYRMEICHSPTQLNVVREKEQACAELCQAHIKLC